MLYTLRFFLSSKCSLFHNANCFGSCIIHILYTGCAEIEKNNSGAKGLIYKMFNNYTELSSTCVPTSVTVEILGTEKYVQLRPPNKFDSEKTRCYRLPFRKML